MWQFLRRYPIPSIICVVGAVLSIGSRLNDAYGIISSRLPNAIWEAVGLIIFFAAAIHVLYQWDKEHRAVSAAKPPAAAVVTTVATHLLKEKYVYGGSSNPQLLPRFCATFAVSAHDVRIFVDQAHFISAINNTSADRTNRRRILISELPRVSRDQQIEIPIMVRHETEHVNYWKWGSDGTGSASTNEAILSHSIYKARIAVVDKNDRMDCCYFVILPPDGQSRKPLEDVAQSDMPRVVGEHIFDHARKWDAEDGPA